MYARGKLCSTLCARKIGGLQVEGVVLTRVHGAKCAKYKGLVWEMVAVVQVVGAWAYLYAISDWLSSGVGVGTTIEGEGSRVLGELLEASG